MSKRAGFWVISIIALGAFTSPAIAKTASHPKTGKYTATAGGSSFSFTIKKATCASAVKGQHTKAGYCFEPGVDPKYDVDCADGAGIDDFDYSLFPELLSSKGELSEPLHSSDGSTGTFKITVSKTGKLSGSLQITAAAPKLDGSTEQCSVGPFAITRK